MRGRAEPCVPLGAVFPPVHEFLERQPLLPQAVPFLESHFSAAGDGSAEQLGGDRVLLFVFSMEARGVRVLN